MNDEKQQTISETEAPGNQQAPFDYTFVSATARIALYDDLRSAPRVTEITPAETTEFIENLASRIYEQSKMAGGAIPYTVIREVSENFIHARFAEMTVSILDNGNTIRFADQGPGIKSKDKAQIPGFTSAVEPMKKYIRGVGSGLPIVKEYLDFSHGTITIEDNLVTGAVVTVSLNGDQPKTRNGIEDAAATAGRPSTTRRKEPARSSLTPPLSQRERDFLELFLTEGALGITDLKELTGIAPSSIHVALKKLEEAGLVETTVGKKRILTDFGYETAEGLQ